MELTQIRPSGLQLPDLPMSTSANHADRPAARKAAKDFEALFVSLMLKTMRESMSEDMFAGDASDTFGGMFDSFMGQHIADHGGVGLASLFSGPAFAGIADESAAKAGLDRELPGQNPAHSRLEAYADAVALGE